jgi:hypothetical protein
MQAIFKIFMQGPLKGFHQDLHKILSQGPLQDLGPDLHVYKDLQYRTIMHYETFARSS